MKKSIVVILSLLLLATGLACRAEGRDIVARTAVTKWGQLPQAFEVSGQELPEDVSAADFAIAGEATAWGARSTHPFECGVEAVEAAEDGWRLIPETFPDKYFYVESMQVTCEGHPELSFTMEDIGLTTTEVADEFAPYEDADHQLTACVYLPEADAPVPVVIVFHGYGDTQNLLTYRTAVAWAEPDSQAKRPCAVIAPSIPDAQYTSEFVRSKIFEGVLAWIDAQADAGKVDPKRVYAMGNSFGGMSAIEIAEQHPERIAAVLALCPALNYSVHGTQNLPLIAHIPVGIAQAEHDETIPVDVGYTAAQALENAGNENVELRIYNTAEMNAAGASFGYENTYSFHHVELAVMEGEEFQRWADWLFGWVKE